MIRLQCQLKRMTNKIVHEMHLQLSPATVYGIMRSIPWLIMPGLHISSGDQQQRCCLCRTMPYVINTLRPRKNGRHFADDIFKRIFFNKNVWISIKISLKFVPKGPINKTPALFKIMAWRRPGDKPLSDAMLVSLLTHKCVTRPQWVKEFTTIYPSVGSRNGSKIQIWIQWNLMNIQSTAQGIRDTHTIGRGSAVITYVFIS